MNADDPLGEIEKHKLNLETGEVPWQELQRPFARGALISVHAELDLVDVAFEFARDNKAQMETWLASRYVHRVTDEQAREWQGREASLWAVVVKPWVLVQAR